MRPAPAAVAPYLAANRSFILSNLITFSLTHGELLQYSGATTPYTLSAGFFPSQSLSAAGGTFYVGPKFGNPKTKTKIGLQADSIDLEIIAGANDAIGTLTWQNAFRQGVFDGAFVEVSRLVCQTNNIPVGAIVWFQGYVGSVEIGRSMITATINSMPGLFNVQYPRRLWQHDCGHIFGDAMCQFDRTSMQVLVVASTNSTQSQIWTGFAPSPITLYDGGTIIGNSGANAGYKRTVTNGENGIAFLSVPFIYPVTVGDTFTMLPGCDHKLATCRDVFNNLAHHGGFPWIPPAEFAV